MRRKTGIRMSIWWEWKKDFCRIKAALTKSRVIEEERRLAYVGIINTARRKSSPLHYVKSAAVWGTGAPAEPSRFLLELPQDDLIWEQERKVVSARSECKGQSHSLI